MGVPLVVNQHGNDTAGQVLKFVPKEKAQTIVAQVDDAGQAIVAKIRAAADLAKEECDRAMVPSPDVLEFGVT